MDSMEYIYPSISEEMEYLELEVKDEMSTVGAETSFTTQRKVFQFLVTDLENHNVAFVEQMREYRKDTEKRLENVMIELQNLRRELDNVNRENVQLHEMLIFFGNQLNRRASTLRASNSSITSDDSSILLDNILDELNNSTANDINNCKLRVDNAIDVIRKSVSTASSLSTVDREENHALDEVVESLADTIIAKDVHQENLVAEIKERDEYIELLLKQTEQYNSDVFDDSTRENIETLEENIALKNELLERQEKLIRYLQTRTDGTTNTSPSTTPEGFHRGLLINGNIFPFSITPGRSEQQQQQRQQQQ